MRSYLPRMACPVIVRLCLLLGLLTVPAVPGLAAGHTASPEYKIKAALLYKLTKFIEWPQSAKQAPGEFNICVLGDNVFADALDPLTKRKVSERSISIHYFNRSDAIDQQCHILFITDSKRAFLANILGSINTQGCLTVSDINDFAEQGGVIELTQGKNKIGFKINLAQAKQADIALAAPLLELSTVINQPGAGAGDD
ncbi:MAG: YfiR family protein [Gammaproteobacteria bacterium]|nr:YfiR family protein [Gammaproteobacteria bacterium]